MLRRALVIASLVAIAPRPAAAGDCRTVSVDFLPAESPNPDAGLRRPLQIASWIETPGGEYEGTIFLTQDVGTYGLGNRPGRFDFNSAPKWPYGRRITVFPVWSHKHGLEFPQVTFRNNEENNLSHPADQSSSDGRYCAPLQRLEPEWDVATCATVGFTDKGVLTATPNRYPPRQDLVRDPNRDAIDVEMFGDLNPFDAVSQASPVSGAPAMFSWPLEPDLPAGEYVLWLEVSREFDHNATYNESAYPAPAMIPWAEYGVPYRGQPSVLYKIPFTVGDGETIATTTDYAGYGDPDGLDGNVRAPDGTITTDTPGSGAARLAIVPGGGYRARVIARIEPDYGPPAATMQLTVDATTSRSTTIAFIAPGDDGVLGNVKTYEVRYRIGGDITEDTFATAIEVKPELQIVPTGELQMITIDKLLPETTYTLAIRAIDDCGNAGPITTIEAKTAARTFGEVEWCFIATAAYGSVLANDVESLRMFRDSVLEKTVLGTLLVESYYTFSPTLSGLIGESDLLRATARELIGPIVRTVRSIASVR